jgi:hypothetical protein
MAECATSPLDDLVAAFRRLTTVAVDDLDSGALGEGIVAISGLVDGLQGERARWLRPFEQRNGHRDDGAVSIVAWTAHRCHLSPGAAAETVTTARHLAALPETAQALRAGQIGFQHAAVIARAADDLGDEPVGERETILVDAARALEVRGLRQVTARLRDCIDADGALRDANRDHERRRVQLGQTLGGWFHLEGWLTTSPRRAPRARHPATRRRDASDGSRSAPTSHGDRSRGDPARRAGHSRR